MITINRNVVGAVVVVVLFISFYHSLASEINYFYFPNAIMICDGGDRAIIRIIFEIVFI